MERLPLVWRHPKPLGRRYKENRKGKKRLGLYKIVRRQHGLVTYLQQGKRHMTTRFYFLILLIFSALVIVSFVSSTSPVSAEFEETAANLFSDTFGDGNKDGWVIVDANGSTDGPSNWSVVPDAHNYVLRQNSNIWMGFEGTYAYAGDSSWTDYQFEMDVFPTDDDTVFVMFRYVDDNNYYRFHISSQRNFRRLEKKVNGVYTTITEDLTKGYAPNVWQHIQISMTGNNIQVSFNYQLIFSVTDTSFTSGKIALGTAASENCLFDNIVVGTSLRDPYADAVIEANIKQGNNARPDPRFALGRTFTYGNDALFVGGPGYWITVDMGKDEEIIDGEGNDLRVTEIGDIYGTALNEEHDVYASNSITGTWHYLGQGMAVSEFDLQDVGLSKARYIKIQDLSTKTDGTNSPGSDIDGAQALNMENYFPILPPQSVNYAVAGQNVSLTWERVTGAVEYRVYVSDSVGSSNIVRANLVPITSNFFTHADSSHEKFFYSVTAIDAAGVESAFSTQVPYQIFMPTIMKK